MMTPEQETTLQQRVQELLETDDCDSVLRPDGVFQMTVAGEQRWSFFGRLQHGAIGDQDEGERMQNG